jgi:putative tricarboxylic transport membrane protein
MRRTAGISRSPGYSRVKRAGSSGRLWEREQSPRFNAKGSTPMALQVERQLGDRRQSMWARVNVALVPAVFFFISLWICLEAIQVPFGSFRMPGAGFFPLLLGVTLGLLSLVFLAMGFFGDAAGVTQVTPSRPEILYLIGTMFISVWLFERAGYLLTMALFLGVTMKLLAKTQVIVAVIIALMGSVASYLLFDHVLMIVLPAGILPF